MPRSRKVFKKRKGTFFKGRNITSSSNSTLDADVSNNDIKTDIKNPCAKERKIPDLNASFSTFEGNIGVINAIMNLNILSFVFKNDVRCKKCDNGMDMQVLKNNSGLAISFVLKCCVCPYRVEFSSSDYHEGTQRATVNTRYVYAMRSIGRGAEAGRMFCALMNLPQPPTRFAPYNKRLLNAVKLVSEETMQKATQEAVLENGSNNNIAVAVDGTWQKREKPKSKKSLVEQKTNDNDTKDKTDLYRKTGRDSTLGWKLEVKLKRIVSRQTRGKTGEVRPEESKKTSAALLIPPAVSRDNM
ncbi:uncharacterized protein NPIL_215571 [Nephila pilipes]|uniref:Mutator-like transposase domain-containing protein n=1 Tax=Nephila pilipes TaxID=299642 RepID=A0A8X6P7F0_NEPPI|nr:uncharacterized protein NPIL_215571 [Nephila pilipes]